ncbi:MAG: hypothetical protein EPN21_00185 [Methylococcaceae bacterium]|nr:MAG: hypothetical protein EPN21_00185 [Methylococcaceae bacterium]
MSHCLDAVAALLAPEEDLDTVGRDDLATLLSYLLERRHWALAACQPMGTSAEPADRDGEDGNHD